MFDAVKLQNMAAMNVFKNGVRGIKLNNVEFFF
jgi:hypothetical protein